MFSFFRRSPLQWVILGLVFFRFGPVAAQSRLAQQNNIRLMLGLERYGIPQGLASVRVAILDNGFEGYDPSSGVLPQNTRYFLPPGNPPLPTAHGLGMAQIVWGVTGHSELGPEIHLVNTNGFTNFKAAVDYVIDQKIDIVLYSQGWFWGGNFDGGGFINAQVTRATKAGIIWINSAGNDRHHVYTGKVLPLVNKTKSVKLPGTGNTIRFASLSDSNPVRIKLSWTGFTESENFSTNKDLDITLYDSLGRSIPVMNFDQTGSPPDPKDPADRRSSLAREEVSLNLNRGNYALRIHVKNAASFDASDDFRVVVTSERDPDSLKLIDQSPGRELGIPADNRQVFTVGDCSSMSSRGPTRDGRLKPEIAIRESFIELTDGTRARGTSNAAAMFAGSVAVMKGFNPQLNQDLLWDLVLKFWNTPQGARCGGTPVWTTPPPQP